MPRRGQGQRRRGAESRRRRARHSGQRRERRRQCPGADRKPPAQAAAVPLSGLAVEITAQAHAGNKHFEIRLDPPELGRIDVKLDVDRDGNVSTRLVVDRADTLDLLKRDASALERALQQSGLKTSDNALEFSLRQQGFAQRRHGRADRRAFDRAGRRSGAARGDAAGLRPAARSRRRPRHQSVRNASWPASFQRPHRRSSPRRRPTRLDQLHGQHHRRRQGHHRRQLPDLPDAAHDAAQEPEPARPARHQPVHRAARAVRPGRAAAQVRTTSSPRWSRCRRPRSTPPRSNSSARPSAVDGATAPLQNGTATWNLSVPKPATGDDQHQERDRPDRLHRHLFDERRHVSPSSGTARTQAACNGPTATTPSRSPRRTPAASRSRCRPRSRRRSIPPISPRPRRCFRSPDRTTRSIKSSASSAIRTDRAVTLRSFLAAGALHRRPFRPRFAGISALPRVCADRRQCQNWRQFLPNCLTRLAKF